MVEMSNPNQMGEMSNPSQVSKFPNPNQVTEFSYSKISQANGVVAKFK